MAVVSDWQEYLTSYFGPCPKDLIEALVQQYLLPTGTDTEGCLVDAQLDRRPILVRYPQIALPPTVEVFIDRYTALPHDTKIGFFDSSLEPATIDSFLLDNKHNRSSGRSVVEDLPPNGPHATSTLDKRPDAMATLDIVNRDNLLWRSGAGKFHCAISGVLSEPRARSVSHYHHLPFWNLSLGGTKLYVLYDIRHVPGAQYARDNTLSTVPLTWATFLAMAQEGRAWLAAITDRTALFVPEHIAHDVYTLDHNGLYRGLQGNWLTDIPESLETLIYASFEENGDLRFKITVRDISRIVYGSIYTHIVNGVECIQESEDDGEDDGCFRTRDFGYKTSKQKKRRRRVVKGPPLPTANQTLNAAPA